MKLQSIGSLAARLIESFRRFPLALISAFAGSVIIMILFHMNQTQMELHFHYWNIVMSCYLLMLMAIAATAYAERSKRNGMFKWTIQLTCIVIAAIYYFSLPAHYIEMTLNRFFLFALALHMFIALAPFTAKGEVNGFWQYNKSLLLRFLTTAFFAHVLYLGLMLAILAVNELFKAGIDEKIFFDLWVFLVGIFQTWFFLIGFPEKYDTLDQKTDYPKGVKIFTQYVLLPLLTIYLLILYAFLFRIIFTNQFPDGWISALVLGFSTAGILSLLLVYPVQDKEGNKWMKLYSRFFYFMLLPLLILLFLAIRRRIVDYGITENRYYVFVLVIWLLFISIYYLLSKVKNIKLIPLSLGVIALVTSFGPWGAFAVSLHSQKKHLESVCSRSRIFSNGTFQMAPDNITPENSREISSVVEYMVFMHGYQKMQPYFTPNIDSLLIVNLIATDINPQKKTEKILNLINVTYAPSYQTKAYNDKIIDFSIEPGQSIEIAGYDYFIPDFNVNNFESTDSTCKNSSMGSYKLNICLNMKKNILSINGIPGDEFKFDLKELINSVKEKKYVNYNCIKQEDLTLNSQNHQCEVKIIFRSCNGEYTDNELHIIRLHADILLKMNKDRINEASN